MIGVARCGVSKDHVAGWMRVACVIIDRHEPDVFCPHGDGGRVDYRLLGPPSQGVGVGVRTIASRLLEVDADDA